MDPNPPSSSIQVKEEQLYEQAFALADKGYGDFDKCLNVLKSSNGNQMEAEKILSQLIFNESNAN